MLSKLIKDYLELKGLIGGSSGWTGYAVKLPDSHFTPDDAIAIIEETATQEGNDSRYISDGIPEFIGNVKLVIRAVDLEAMLEHFERVCREMDLIANVPIVDEKGELVHIQSCNRTSGIQYTGLDGTNRRHLATVQYAIKIP
jgi:hypothetical protein